MLRAQEGLMMITQGQGKEELAVSLSVRELRALVKDEIIAALDSRPGSTSRQVQGSNNSHQTVFSIKEAADYTRLSVSTLRAAIRKGELVSHKVGRRVLVRRADLEKFLNGVWCDA